MEKQVSILLVAVGGYGANYMQELERRMQLPAYVEGICEVMQGIEERFPSIKEKQIPVYHAIDSFYEKHRAELAIISTPIHLHFEQIQQCLKGGSNVLTEKPVCTSVEGARKLMELEKETGHVVSVGYQLNYSRDVLAMKRDILSGVYGEPVLMKGIHAMRRGSAYYERNNWAGEINVDGCFVNDSPFNNACAHQFQNMTFLLGETIDTACDIVSVKAEPYKGNHRVGNFDIVALKAETEKGIPIYYYTAHALRDKKLGPITEFRFERGTIYFGRDADGSQIDSYVGRLHDGTIISYGEIQKGERLQKLDDAIDCVLHGGRPVCTIQAAIAHLQAVTDIASIPIISVKKEKIQLVEENGECFYYVKHLKEIFEECYQNHKLPGELGLL